MSTGPPSPYSMAFRLGLHSPISLTTTDTSGSTTLTPRSLTASERLNLTSQTTTPRSVTPPFSPPLSARFSPIPENSRAFLPSPTIYARGLSARDLLRNTSGFGSEDLVEYIPGREEPPHGAPTPSRPAFSPLLLRGRRSRALTFGEEPSRALTFGRRPPGQGLPRFPRFDDESKEAPDRESKEDEADVERAITSELIRRSSDVRSSDVRRSSDEDTDDEVSALTEER